MAPVSDHTFVHLVQRTPQINTETQTHNEKSSLVIVIILSALVAAGVLGLVITLVICKCRRDRKTKDINARFSQQAPPSRGVFTGHGSSGNGMGNRSVVTSGGGSYQRLEDVGEAEMREGGVWSAEMEMQGRGRPDASDPNDVYERRRSLSTIGEESSSVAEYANRSSRYYESSHLNLFDGSEPRVLKDVYR